MLTRISSTALLIKTGKKLDKLKQPPSCKRWGFFIASPLAPDPHCPRGHFSQREKITSFQLDQSVVE